MHQKIAGKFVGRLITAGAVVALCLVGYGVFLNPATNRLSIAAAVTALLAYIAIGRLLIPVLLRRYSAALEVASGAGSAAAAVFGAEICLEYVVLPKNNAPWGMVEFGLILLIYACAGFWLAFTTQNVWEATIGSALSAVISSVVWCTFILATFYLFYGTDRQQQVFQAEGNFDDFRRSGMSDFGAFITEDFFGATFFHLTLGPAIGSLLGMSTAVIGKGTAIALKRRPRRSGSATK